jgi:hypothetical protein
LKGNWFLRLGADSPDFQAPIQSSLFFFSGTTKLLAEAPMEKVE